MEKIDLYSDDELGKLFAKISEENSNFINEKHTEDKLILFVSFDLVEFTKFKLYNSTIWLNIIYDVTNRIQKKVSEIDINFQLWRSIGDEVVFTIEVPKMRLLEDFIQKIFCTLNALNKEIKSGDIFNRISTEEKLGVLQQNIISLKSTAWIAMVSTVNVKDNFNKGKKLSAYNIQYDIKLLNDNHKMTEFQGIDIDAGFRIAKNCTKSNRLALSVELAYLLSLNECIRGKINFISFQSLKGIWDGKLYPVLWYHDQYVSGLKLEESFSYDEQINDDNYKSLLEMKERYKHININSFLHKIISDRGLYKKMELIKSLLKDEGEDKGKKAIPLMSGISDIEVHCVAVCKNSEGKIMIAKRSEADEGKFKGLWDFGCSKMTKNMNFREVLTQDYKNTFNIRIKVNNPFIDYDFERNGMKISGIRYEAEIIDSSDIKCSAKYSEVRFVDKKEFMEMNKEEFINYNQFLEIFNLLLIDDEKKN